jgi:polyisoprenyl-teichoic acid--peptidoglycan teichoic acid transferase
LKGNQAMANSENGRFSRHDVGNSSFEETSRYSSRYSREVTEDPVDTQRSSSQNPEAYSRYSREMYGDGGTHRASARATRARAVRERPVRSGSQTGRGGKKKIVAIVIGIILALAIAGVAAAAIWVNVIDKNLSSGIDDSFVETLPEYSGKPFYMLLVGVDRDEERSGDAEFAGSFRTDTMMLARIDPQNKKVTLVSLPRDTMTDMSDIGQGYQKLNSAYTWGNSVNYPGGGQAYLVKKVEDLCASNGCAIEIEHYAEVDFDGFVSVVDALGGIEVDVPVAIDDDDAGGHLDAGLQTLDGTQAMILCRSRHTYDSVGAGDLYRAANQRMVLSAIAKKLLDSDVPTIKSVVESAAGKAVSTDLTVANLLSMAGSMRGLDPANDIYTCAMPTTSSYIDSLWYEVIDTASWAKILSHVDQGLPPTETTVIDETTGTILSSNGDGSTASTYGEQASDGSAGGTVAVRNGGAASGSATKVAELLTNAGYTTDSGNADAETYKTTLVVYSNANQADAAAAILKKLGVGKTMKNDGSYDMSNHDYLVILGSDYVG